jgi:hypothetical protein
VSEPFVVAHLFQPASPIRLRHTTDHLLGGVPAVLVIPRGGTIRAPHLMVLSGSPADVPMPVPIPAYGLAGAAHIVADVDNVRDRGVRALADVLLTRRVRQPAAAAARVSDTLDCYMGCAVAVARSQGGCLMGMRDGRLAEVTGAGGFHADREPWPAVLGSLLYMWLTARIPLTALGAALVIAGHYTGDRDAGCELRVAGRVTIGVRPNVWAGRLAEQAAS